jgi:peptide chain release factor subunit 1
LVEPTTFFHACHLASSNSVKLHKLRKQLAWLSNKVNKEKEFVSLYLPSKTSVAQILVGLKVALESELNTENTYGQFNDVFKTITQYLKEKTVVPEMGTALFAGEIFDVELGKERLILEEIIPPEPIVQYHFSVDSHFDLEPLRKMLRDQKVVGAIVLDSKTASFGLKNGESWQIIDSITSGVPGKSGKGGQSQRRYERERDMEISNFFHRVGEHATGLFMENKVNVLVIGGPGQTKNDFLKGDYLHYELMNSLVDIVDTQTAAKGGLKEALEKSGDAIKNMCGPEEKRFVQRLLKALNKDGLATYGLAAVIDSLKKGEVEVALVSDDSGFVEVIAQCRNCGLVKVEISSDFNSTVKVMLTVPCVKCGKSEYEVSTKDIVDVLEDLATQTSAVVEVISTVSREKSQLASLGGVAALLRYKSESL